MMDRESIPSEGCEAAEDSLPSQPLMLFQQHIELALPLNQVQEILDPSRIPITPIPNTLAGIRGILNLRGQLIGVVDLGYLLSRTHNSGRHPNRVIIMRSLPSSLSHSRPPDQLGLLVERVHQVVSTPLDQICPAPDLKSVPARLRARLSPLTATTVYWQDCSWQILSVPALRSSSLWI